ncbi:MAG: hypothetical protein D3922_02440 [Candidatus Electrothrix sp. AR1]|nr:hypothetical protein [Candidatus Electrothrix sp. AR1]
MDKKLNCWEFKKCGREPGGRNVSQYGVCSIPVAIDRDGINGGKNGGRACWMWRELACIKIMQKCSVQEIRECRECDFYLSVKKSRSPHDSLISQCSSNDCSPYDQKGLTSIPEEDENPLFDNKSNALTFAE